MPFRSPGPVTTTSGPNRGGRGIYVEDPDGNAVEIVQLARPWGLGSTVETGLDGKTALVTGAAGGIGRACCAALAAEGAQVVCADLDGQAAAMTALTLGGHPVAGDVTSRDDAVRIVEEAVESDGRARRRRHEPWRLPVHPRRRHRPGRMGSHPVRQPPRHVPRLPGRPEDHDAPPERGDRHDRVARRPGRWPPRRCGVRGLEGRRGGVHQVARTPSRTARGIRVNCVNPGFIDTPMTETWSDETRREVVERTPLGRIGTADGGRRCGHLARLRPGRVRPRQRTWT